MIASLHILVDIGLNKPVQAFLVNHKVIQPPTQVFLPTLEPRAKVAELLLLWMKVPESVSPPLLQKPCKPFPLFGCKASSFRVGLRVGKIDFLVSDIQVSTEDRGLFLFKLRQVVLEIYVPLLRAVVQASKLFPGVGDIASH